MENTTAKATVRPIGFFDRADKDLERLTPRKDLRLDQYTKEDLWARDENGRMKVKIPQFVYCNAVLSKNISKKTNLVFYNCDIYISNPFHRVLKNFTESNYIRIMLDNDLNLQNAETIVPARVRFSKGYSQQSLSQDHSFYLMEVIIPGNEKCFVLSDFLTGSDISLISILSKKVEQECIAQGIENFNAKGFKLYYAESDEFVKRDLWESQEIDED